MSPKRRTTQQSKAIAGAITSAERPLTVPEIHAEALDVCHGLGVATVYRAVNRLVDEGWLREVQFAGQPARYERRAMDHHHHFRCEQCERVLDVTAPCDTIAANLPEGFVVSGHEVTFFGTCADCATL